MSAIHPSPFARYLLAKRSVDDRALNRNVYNALLAQLSNVNAPLRTLEIGCGVGTMLERIVRWGMLQERRIDYLGIDNDAGNIAAATAPDAPNLTARFEVADFYTFAELPAHQSHYDLVIAHAVLDLFDLDRALPLVRALLRPGGLGWFTINFDGATIFEPPLEGDPNDALNTAMLAAYHATMDARTIDGAPAGASATGRRLLSALPRAGLPVLAAGASDWVVFPCNGAYPNDEQAFLEAILGFFAHSLDGAAGVSPAARNQWLTQRHAQIARAELSYIAHQLDFLVARPAEVNS